MQPPKNKIYLIVDESVEASWNGIAIEVDGEPEWVSLSISASDSEGEMKPLTQKMYRTELTTTLGWQIYVTEAMKLGIPAFKG